MRFAFDGDAMPFTNGTGNDDDQTGHQAHRDTGIQVKLFRPVIHGDVLVTGGQFNDGDEAQRQNRHPGITRFAGIDEEEETIYVITDDGKECDVKRES
mgnify:CR=1 FL=1